MENLYMLFFALLGAYMIILLSFGSDDKVVQNYKSYLKTKHWQRTRRKALARGGYKCALCSSKDNLNVHHNNYKNLWHEKNTDLIVLCRDHHKMVHNKK